MSGGGGQSTNTVQSADPWKGVQPYLEKGYGEADRLFDTGGPEMYPGQTYVDRNPLENAAQMNRLGYAMNQMPGQISDMQAANRSMLGAADVANNPYVTGMLDVTQDRLNRNLNENLMPSVERGYAARGQLGSSKQGIAEGMAIRGTQDALAAANAQIMSDAYNRGMDAQYQGLVTAPSTMQQGMLPAEIMSGVGAYQRGEDELALGEAMSRHSYDEQRPYSNLNQYMGLLQGTPWGSTSSSVGGAGRSDTFGNILGAGSLGLGAYNAGLFGLGAAGGTALASSMGPLVASGTGAVSASSLLPFFAASDKRLKKNIKEIDEPSPYKWYEFEYKNPIYGQGKQVGVMAQEVEKINPYAVAEMPNGFKAVNYGAL